MKYIFLISLLLFAVNSIPLFTFNERHTSNYPYLSGDSLRAACDFVFDEAKQFDPADVQKPSVIFVKTDLLDQFFKSRHAHIKFPYILVTHNSDDEAPGKFAAYLDDPKIIHWFGQNPSIGSHAKFSPVPIGIANEFWPHGKKEIFDRAIARASQIAKKYMLYVNFSFFDAPFFDDACVIYQKERADASNKLSGKPFVYIASRKSSADYLDDLAASYFVASPRGHGLDCHRTWEALLMGAYPIVKTSPLDSVFADLPVFIINSWDEVTEEFLEIKRMEFASKNRTREKLYAQYWIDKIRSTLRGDFLK